MIPRLGEHPGAPFPPAHEALDEPDGLLAWGGDLSPERLLRAYGRGIFPWFSDEDPILWWCPAQRCVLPTEKLHVSRRLARRLHNGNWRFSADTAFDQVLDGCADSRDSTWITPAMKQAYRHLHELGYAHSFEAWLDDELAGGLYGVGLGRMFFGESMFSARTDGSKAVLTRLCPALKDWGIPWLDCQVPNPHLTSLGARSIPRDEFLDGLGNKMIESHREEFFEGVLKG